MLSPVMVLTPFALKAARGSDPDTLSWDEAMGAPDREQWIAAALSEF